MSNNSKLPPGREPLTSDWFAEQLGQSQQRVMSLTVAKRQLEDRVAKAIELLERIAAHDHQGAATWVLLNAPSGTEESMAAYENILNEVARTDIQSWALQAILHLRGEDADGN